MFGFGAHHKWRGVAKLNEEAGEVVQEIGKLMMIGGKTNHWSGDLRERLRNEMADCAAALQFVMNENFSDAERNKFHERRAAKLTKFYQWDEEGEAHENDRPILS